MIRGRILINTPDLKRSGGVAEYLRTLSLDSEPGIDYFCIHGDDEQSSLQIIYRILNKYIMFWQRIKHYDLIHFHPSFVKKSFFRDLGFILLARLQNKKTLVTMHGWDEDFEQKVKKSYVFSTLFRISYAKVDAYIVLGDIFKKKLKSLFVKTDRYFIVPTVADDSWLSDFDIKNRISTKDRTNILFLSRIEKEKGIYIAIDAVSKLATPKPVTLIIAGDGPELVNVKQFVAQNKIDNVKFTGFIVGQDKHDVLSKADIFFFPSYSEGLPIVIIEAMLYGLPIVSRITGAIPDVVEHGVNGFLSTSRDPGDFVPYLQRLMEDQELYTAIATANHKKASQYYTKEKVRQRILSIYEQIADH